MHRTLKAETALPPECDLAPSRWPSTASARCTPTSVPTRRSARNARWGRSLAPALSGDAAAALVSAALRGPSRLPGFHDPLGEQQGLRVSPARSRGSRPRGDRRRRLVRLLRPSSPRLARRTRLPHHGRPETNAQAPMNTSAPRGASHLRRPVVVLSWIPYYSNNECDDSTVNHQPVRSSGPRPCAPCTSTLNTGRCTKLGYGLIASSPRHRARPRLVSSTPRSGVRRGLLRIQVPRPA